MKTLATLIILLLLAGGSLGYVNYRQAQSLNALNLQMSTLTEEVSDQHLMLVTHKKAIQSLRSNLKQSDKAVLAILLFLKSQESDPSPKTESNAYVTGN